MSRPFSIHKRIRTLVLGPAVGGAVLLGAISLLSFRSGAPIVGAFAIATAVILGVGGIASYLNTNRALRAGLANINSSLEAIEAGREAHDARRGPISELHEIDTRLAEVAAQRRLVRAQAEAVSAGTYDSPVLDRPSPGPVGKALWSSLSGFRRTNYALRDSQAVTSTLMDKVSDAIAVVDNDGRIIVVNSVAQVALDLYKGSLDDTVPGWRQFPVGDHEFSRTMSDGTLAITQVSTTRLITANGALNMLCWRDMSGERAVQAQVAQIARTDIVTGLPNRQGIMAAHARLHELGRTASVIHIDLADFGQLNQRFGIIEGDHVLQETAQRLRKVIRDEDTVARISGDEFVMLLTSQGDNVDALARRILDRIAEPIQLLSGQTVRVAAHAGWSSGLVDGTYELLRRANYALTEARSTPGSVSGYSAEVAQRDEYRRQWEIEVRRAIENDELRLFAQPIVDVLERRVLGVEVFLRWQHPSGRLIGPNEFMPIAERSDLVAELDRWVIETCIRSAVEADPSVVFSLNVSNRFMASSDMASFVTRTLASSGLPAGRIQIDVTETNVATDVDSVIDSIRRLNETGVRVALDDFGTGYSSLAHLLRLAVSTVKVDRRVVGMVNEPEGRGVLAAIIAFAHKRKLDVVAEGVESAEEVAALVKLGCRFQQGYFHGHPAPLADVLGSLDSIPFHTLEYPGPPTKVDGDTSAAVAPNVATVDRRF